MAKRSGLHTVRGKRDIHQCRDGEWFWGPYRLDERGGTPLGGFYDFDTMSPEDRQAVRDWADAVTKREDRQAMLNAFRLPSASQPALPKKKQKRKRKSLRKAYASY